jgi:hypothetical protein
VRRAQMMGSRVLAIRIIWRVAPAASSKPWTTAVKYSPLRHPTATWVSYGLTILADLLAPSTEGCVTKRRAFRDGCSTFGQQMGESQQLLKPNKTAEVSSVRIVSSRGGVRPQADVELARCVFGTRIRPLWSSGVR